jgi:hypothetical protein
MRRRSQSEDLVEDFRNFGVKALRWMGRFGTGDFFGICTALLNKRRGCCVCGYFDKQHHVVGFELHRPSLLLCDTPNSTFQNCLCLQIESWKSQA